MKEDGKRMKEDGEEEEGGWGRGGRRMGKRRKEDGEEDEGDGEEDGGGWGRG